MLISTWIGGCIIMEALTRYRVGIDVGGTFTDIIFINENTGEILDTKVLNKDDNRVNSVLEGIKKLTNLKGISFNEISRIGHGTTITTNAVIERKGSKTALITNKNFRDILEIGKFSRSSELIYNIHKDKPKPIVPRYLRFGLNCRIDRNGNNIIDFDKKELLHLIKIIKEEKVESVAICFLFSFLNPLHEEQVRDELFNKLDGIDVVLSSEIMREFREFPRVSTTAFAAYVAPILRDYISNLLESLKSNGIDSPLYVFQSNGGVAEPEIIMRNPALTLLSGPAGAVVGAKYYCQEAGYNNLITMDIGGTSLDICLINNLQAQITSNREIDMFPVSSPMLDVHTVGAGGGSIISVDEVGRVKVGPKSMGANPGPACYNFGGNMLTITDINLLMGILDSSQFASGELPLSYDAAKNALIKKISNPLNLNFHESVIGVYKVITNQISEEIRKITVESGKDPRDFTLVAFGGGGPLHVSAVAKELGVKKVLIPKFPGLFSSLGIATSDFTHDYVQSYISSTSSINFDELNNVLENLIKDANFDLNKENIRSDRRKILTSFDMRYIGQTTEVNIELDKNTFPIRSFNKILELFHKKHERLYTYSVYNEPVELVNIRIRGVGVIDKIVDSYTKNNSESFDKSKFRLAILPDEKKEIKIPVFQRDKIPLGEVIKGPMLIEEASSTTLVLKNMTLMVDEFRNLIIEIE